MKHELKVWCVYSFGLHSRAGVLKPLEGQKSNFLTTSLDQSQRHPKRARRRRIDTSSLALWEVEKTRSAEVLTREGCRLAVSKPLLSRGRKNEGGLMNESRFVIYCQENTRENYTTVFQTHTETWWWEYSSLGLFCLLWGPPPEENKLHPHQVPLHSSETSYTLWSASFSWTASWFLVGKTVLNS